jgi:hypothetical protein
VWLITSRKANAAGSWHRKEVYHVVSSFFLFFFFFLLTFVYIEVKCLRVARRSWSFITAFRASWSSTSAAYLGTDWCIIDYFSVLHCLLLYL